MTANPQLRLPQPAHVRDVWPSEPQDFTPWLAEHLDVLDVLDIGPLTNVGIEHEVPGTARALDILATTADGRLVAIENQYQRADHDHLTRALAYAVALDARAAVVIAEEHSGEFRAVARYLNNCAEQLGAETGIAVFLVEVAVAKVEQYYAPSFTVVEQPNDWITGVSAERPTPIGSEEEFLARCPPEMRESFERILHDWTTCEFNDGATVSYKSQAVVSLYRSNQLKGDNGSTCVFVLNLDGSLTINRQILIDAGLGATEEDAVALDAALAQCFAAVRIVGKNWYPSVVQPDPEAVRAFSQWLAQRIDVLSPSRAD